MRCRWCDGTGEECGCGVGHCDHCGGSGEQPDPPFDQPERIEYMFTREDWDYVGEEKFFNDTINQAMLRVQQKFGLAKALSQEDIETLQAYWNERYREDTIGDFMTRIGWRVLEVNGLQQIKR